MNLPFDLADLRKPVFPPGLSQFARAHKLADGDIEQLARAWGHMRVQPTTEAEWRELLRVVNEFNGGQEQP